MASITIRGIDERIKQRLRQQAARHGQSMEEEARVILSAALTEGYGAIDQPIRTMADVLSEVRKLLDEVGGFDIEVEATAAGDHPASRVAQRGPKAA